MIYRGEEIHNAIEALRHARDAACADGTWNYHPYFHGMANSLIFALHCFENDDPAIHPPYLDAPDEWGCENDDPEYIPTEVEAK